MGKGIQTDRQGDIRTHMQTVGKQIELDRDRQIDMSRDKHEWIVRHRPTVRRTGKQRTSQNRQAGMQSDFLSAN